IHRRERGVAETQALHHARPEVLPDDTGLRAEAQAPGAPRGLRQVEHERLLVAIDREEVRTLAVGQEWRPHRAHRVAAVGRLDLEDLGAHVGEQHRAVRPREHPREVEHAHALEEPHRRAASSAARTRAGVIGSSVKRTPTASCTALATAAETVITPDSPRPLAPNGPSVSCDSMSRTTSSGMSSALKIA